MSTRWRQYPIELLGFSVAFLEGLPVETWQDSTDGGAYQSLDSEDSTVFVHWGQTASLDAFRRSLSDLNTKASDVREWPVEVLDARGLRISATVEQGALVAYRRSPGGVVSHAESPAARYRTEVIAFARGGDPVLVGYRVAESIVPQHAPFLEHFLASVRPL
jgi:hypothetical protein